ncbi:hypothetical protein BDV30DRAFT_71792 [Aspergillus minisclerotigenes]|uniref:C2H2-type domain-containing protein n=1 Tax=Aspergillus minisclerotigenes TaxID=656917 RepID=A0A5N6JL65_9EURO|nr:hypothetical protein BDV30DRAFT_71792 [Aspergillus minisclerotigenes]
MATTIATVLNQCLKEFTDITISGTLGHFESEVSQRRWLDELGRLRVWSGNIGAHQVGQSSLDYRLRDSSHLRSETIKLLQRMIRLLQDLKEVTSAGEDGSQEDDSFFSDASDIELDDDDIVTEVQQIYQGLVDIVNLLFQISMEIRKPADHDRLMGVKFQDASFFEPWAQQHISHKYPNAEAHVVHRLGTAMAIQKAVLKYRERHREKLGKGLFDQGETESRKLSETVATELARSDQLQFLDTVSNSGVSQTSYAPSLLTAQGSISMPAPPREAADGTPFECPYCYLVITIKNTKDWAHHVFRDLMPYVCLFPDCPTPSKLYESRRLWYDHICHAHLATTGTQNGFRCPICVIEIAPPLTFQRHVGRHLEELALFVLPRVNSEDQLSDASSEVGSMSAMKDVDLFILDFNAMESEADNDPSSGVLMNAAELSTALEGPAGHELHSFGDIRDSRADTHTPVAPDNAIIASLGGELSIWTSGGHSDDDSFPITRPGRVDPGRSNPLGPASLHSQSPRDSPDPDSDSDCLSEPLYASIERMFPRYGDEFSYTNPREQFENDSKDRQAYNKNTYTPKRRNSYSNSNHITSYDSIRGKPILAEDYVRKEPYFHKREHIEREEREAEARNIRRLRRASRRREKLSAARFDVDEEENASLNAPLQERGRRVSRRLPSQLGVPELPSLSEPPPIESPASSNPPSAVDNDSVRSTSSTRYHPMPPPKESRRSNRPSTYPVSGDNKPAAASRIASKEHDAPPKGILKPPRDRFPEEPNPVREGVASSINVRTIPPGARWTKIDRRLVNPGALERGGERFEERGDHLIVFRVLSKEEIQAYAILTQEIRDALYAEYRAERRSRESPSAGSEGSLEI